MKPAKISLPSLIGLFCIVGLLADLLPYPGLNPGIVAQSLNHVIATINTPVSAASLPPTNRNLLLNQ